MEFSSPLVNDHNLYLAQGNDWREMVKQIVAKKKPIGFMDSHSGKEMKEAASSLIEAGHAVHCYRYSFSDGADPCWFVSGSQVGRISEMFDIDALIFDYSSYFSGKPEVVTAIETELKKIGRFDLSYFLNFKDVEIDYPAIRDKEKNVAGEYARCGLLLGYPVESTMAIITKYLKTPF